MRVRHASGWALLVVVATLFLATDSHALGVGQKAPEIRAAAWFNTKPLSLKNLTNKIVVVEFWATWCPPCRKSVPHLNSLHKKYKDKGVVVIGLSSEPSAKVRAFVASYRMAYAVGAGSRASGSYGVRGIPHAFLVAPGGKVAWKGHPMGGLEKAIEKALKETPPNLKPKTKRKAPRPVTVYILKDGRRIRARLAVKIGDRYVITDENGRRFTIKKSDVDRIVKEEPAGDEAKSPGSGPELPVYELKDGRSIRVANVVTSGDMLVLKDDKGRFHSVKKSDVLRVTNGAGTDAAKPVVP